jgi:hypothetical protein
MISIRRGTIRNISYAFVAYSLLATLIVSCRLLTADEIQDLGSTFVTAARLLILLVVIVVWLTQNRWRGESIRMGGAAYFGVGCLAIALTCLGALLGARRYADAWDVLVLFALMISFWIGAFWVRYFGLVFGAFLIVLATAAAFLKPSLPATLLGCIGVLLCFAFRHPDVKRQFA